jgi:AI-2 transport protein TqsA
LVGAGTFPGFWRGGGKDVMRDRGGARPQAGAQGPATDPRGSARTWFFGIALALAVAWALRQTIWITLPLAISFFVALAVWPICSRVQARLPKRLRFLGYVAAMATILLLLGLFFGAVWYAAQRIIADFHRYADDFRGLWTGVADWANGLGLPLSIPGPPAAGGNTAAGQPGGSDTALDPITGFAIGTLNSAWQTLSTIILIFFFVLLMLIEAPTWRAKLGGAFGSSRKEAWLDSIGAVAQRFRLYLVLRTAIGLVTGGLYWAWLSLLGVDFALLWGMLAFLLNFIPTLGSFIVFALASLFAMMQQDLGRALVAAGGLFVIEQAMGNVVEPRVQGRRLSISPLVVLVALLVWGWIWGVVGTLVAVPITVLMIIAFAHIPALRPVALLMSDAESMEGLGEATRSE